MSLTNVGEMIEDAFKDEVCIHKKIRNIRTMFRVRLYNNHLLNLLLFDCNCL